MLTYLLKHTFTHKRINVLKYIIMPSQAELGKKDRKINNTKN